ncbi:MAG: DNA-binding protein [Candidatus Diapherotrites archaeon]|nr:DNA-binding protein [Candidatus Diapherotrites archaeon]
MNGTDNNQNEDLKKYYKAQKEIAQQLEAERQLNLVLRQLLTTQARQRLKNVRLVNPELYYKVVQSIVAAAKTGRISVPVDDESIKKLLIKLSEKRETRIVRK